MRQRRKETTMWEEEWNEVTDEGGEERDKKGQKKKSLTIWTDNFVARTEKLFQTFLKDGSLDMHSCDCASVYSQQVCFLEK